ncbi:MAG: hypothetical protein K9L86_07890 [Candidatus Omnitrophica bacterium]|nr:hypothetical protein [Candidatus Omnitrophota bacterium]
MPKTIVIYASFGHGHKMAAQALGKVLDAPVCDLLSFCSPFIGKIYSGLYSFISHHFRHLWQVTFFLTKTKFISYLVNLLHRALFASLFKYLHREAPDVIITTHFFPADLAAYIKHEIEFKLISVITDSRVHPLWVNSDIDYYFATFEITKSDLISLGVEADKIVSGFVPLREGFRSNLSHQELYKQFNLDPLPTVLFVSSSMGVFPFLKKSLDILLKDFNVFVIYGSNQKLRRYLEGANSERLRFFPFYEKIWELIFLSSVIITKPGGMTIFESVHCRKPFIFTHYIPGQEKENMDVLIEAGVAKFVKNRRDFLSVVCSLSKKHEQFQNSYPFELKDVQPVLSDLIQNCLSKDKI